MNTYLIIGDGKLANHLKHYFELSKINYDSWNRSSDNTNSLQHKIKDNDFALLCVSDTAITDFVEKYKTQCQLIHFSGCLEVDGATGFHPLMTFSDQQYTLGTYKKIAFVGTVEKSDFQTALPFLENPYFSISKKDKKHYHALCTLAAGGTTLLWDLFKSELQKMSIPSNAWSPFIEQNMTNIIGNSEGRFTGPWYRDDIDTTEKHLANFYQTPLEDIYRDFYELSRLRSH